MNIYISICVQYVYTHICIYIPNIRAVSMIRELEENPLLFPKTIILHSSFWI
jgi:hypothetical protein